MADRNRPEINPEVIIIGGGFAGVSAAAVLADAGVSVLLLEKKRLLGGRAFSFVDTESNEVIDNGQHLLMRCYQNTLDLLAKLKTDTHLLFQHSLEVDFLDDTGTYYRFKSSRHGSFLRLVIGFLKWRYLSLREKAQSCLAPLFFPFMNLKNLTVGQWLKLSLQPQRMRDSFWAPLCYAALNEPPDKASATLFKKVLTEAFRGSGGRDGLIFPKAGLTDLTGERARQYLEERGGAVKTGCAVSRIQIQNNKVAEVKDIHGNKWTPKAVISALPPSALHKLLQKQPEQVPPSLADLDQCRSTPILSIHLWLSRSITGRPFFTLIDSPIHWIFNRRQLWGLPEKETQFLSLVVSGAYDWMSFSNEEIQAKVEQELSRFFADFDPKNITRIKIIKEPEATLSSSPDMLKFRYGQKTEIENFFLAGDWTDTGLPATIESAVLSGKLAAQEALKTLKTKRAVP